MSDSISLTDLLDLSIGTPHRGAVNFSALHALLQAVLGQLGMRDTKTRWRDSSVDAPVGLPAQEQDRHADELQPGAELQERASSCSPPGPPAEDPLRLWSRIQSCEDGVSKAMSLLQELHEQNVSLREETKELCDQQKTVNAVEMCCHRVDILDNTVRSLRDTVQRYPDPEELSQFVTWDVLQSSLLSERENLQKVLLNSGVVDPAEVISVTLAPAKNSEPSQPDTPSSPHPVPISPSPPSVSAQISTLWEDPLPRKSSGSELYAETVEALRNISKLEERVSQLEARLEARLTALEDRKVEQSQLDHLRELVTNKVSQDASSDLTEQLNQQRALIDGLMSDQEKSVELVNDVQSAILQLQAECEKLHETTRCLHEDNRQKQSHIEELYKTTEELEEKKADKQMVESEIKADKSALESKVSRLQFDSVTEQLNAMFHELLNKVTGQEQDWHKVIDRLSTEMECKLNRIELDSVKKQLEGRWKNIHEKLQAQGAPEHEDAAGLRKQLVDRFHCLSCDRPVVKYSPGPHSVKLPSTPGFPSHKSIRPFTVYALEQFRQHFKSDRVSELADCGHLAVLRSCGGSHTVTLAGQRRSGLQYSKHYTQTEADGGAQSEEVDIVGLDGHIYKGRLNAAALRNTETKLPTISNKDGVCKTKDRAKVALSHRPAASPETGHGAQFQHPHSTRSGPCSRSASSSSGRDWPVSALGCTSQSSVAQPLDGE